MVGERANCYAADCSHLVRLHRLQDYLAGGRCPRATMETLPQDTIKQILRFLPAQSLLVSEMVCRLWRDLASTDDAHWEVSDGSRGPRGRVQSLIQVTPVRHFGPSCSFYLQSQPC